MKWEAVNQDSRDFRGNRRTHPQQWPRRYPYDRLCTTACGRATHTDAEWRHSANTAPLCDSSRSSTSSVRRASRVVMLWRVLEATIAPPCALHWVVTPGRKLFVVNREGERGILALRMAQPSFTAVFVFDCLRDHTHTERTNVPNIQFAYLYFILNNKRRSCHLLHVLITVCQDVRRHFFFSAFVFRCVSTVMIWRWKEKLAGEENDATNNFFFAVFRRRKDK